MPEAPAGSSARGDEAGDNALTLFLTLLIAGFAIAVVVALVRGLVAFFKDAEHLRRTGQASGSRPGEKQNRMMAQRVLFQAAAILLVVLLGSLVAAN
ncbi:twin transmembrane helix small protein [Tsuneonella sp. YG55]|uniref:Twin transmembrane helix small protein n=1 Tax=Tsuneonella litorea TaxID=2976475 RepID=A0A9X2W1Q0_9SPHN|nr:twin transmembrane helix small protein [Tsuneonella litorea]MCT2559343.1 twin transmembrane helix small protein [Tsuneonella litorea]